MPQTNSRADLNKLGGKTPPYFLFFILSLIFIVLSLLAYNYALSRLSTEMTIYNTSHLEPTINPIVTPEPSFIPVASPSADTTPSPIDEPTPTPDKPYLNTYQDTKYLFKIDYWSTRTLFEDHTDTDSRFVFVNPQGNFVVHVGLTDWAWTHSGRELTTKYTLLGQPTFVYETTSQKVVDLNSPSGLFFTLQCVHNGLPDLVKECDQFIKSFAFIGQS